MSENRSIWDKEEISLQKVASPQQGKLTQDDELLTYMAKKGFVGVDSFTYTITDGDKESKEAFIKVKVNENKKPVVKTDYVQLYPGKQITINALGNDFDRERDSIYIHEYSKPALGELMKSGNEFVYTYKKSIAGQDSFHYAISDGFTISEKAVVNILIKDKNDPCYPWLSADVGRPDTAGSLTCLKRQFVVKGSGNDIWNNSDNFHFAHQQIKGDFEIFAKIESIENTHPWAKAGIMIRETLHGNARNTYMAISSENGGTYQQRDSPGQNSQSSGSVEGIKAPYWVKLVRTGNDFFGYTSFDGRKWDETGTASVRMSKNVYVGMAVTSHQDGVICSAVFGKCVVR